MCLGEVVEEDFVPFAAAEGLVDRVRVDGGRRRAFEFDGGGLGFDGGRFRLHRGCFVV